MKKIIIICPYFGKMPNYFDYFLKSCQYNESIDWLIFTDDRTEYSFPSNVTVNYISFNEFREKVQNKFSFSINLNTPYKLCDYRPAYGYIFDKEIQKYDFWGYCDFDIIFGDIRKFITDSLLDQYDKIFCGGHLSLYRNNEYINKAFFRKYKSNYPYKKVFTSNDNFAFDEWCEGSINRILINENNCPYDEILFADIKVKFSNFYVLHRLDKIEEKVRSKTRFFKWTNGKLSSYFYINGQKVEEEFLYVHFQKRDFTISDENIEDKTYFYIYPNHFSFEEYNFKKLKSLCKKRIFYKKWIKFRIKNFKKKLIRMITGDKK